MWSPVSAHTRGVVICRFSGDVPYGLPLNLGERIQVDEQCQGWYRGCVLNNPAVKGVFPSTHVSVKPVLNERSAFYDDPVVEEVTVVLREWGAIWKQLYVKRENYQWTTLTRAMLDLIEWRRQLITGTLTQDQIRDLRLRITSKIDWGNRKLGLDLVPRQEDHVVDPEKIGVYDLYQVHLSSSEKNQSSTWKGTIRSKTKSVWQGQAHHLYFSMRHFGCPMGEDTEVLFSLYSMDKSQFISEKFLVRAAKEGFSSYVEKLNNHSTLFTDLGSADLRKDLYLVVQVVRIGRMVYSESSKKQANQAYRRPHAVAVLELSKEVLTTDLVNDEREFSLKLYQGEEKDFANWHELIAKKQTSKYSPLSGLATYGVVVSLRLLSGDLLALKHEYIHLLKNAPVTKKIGFPDIIMPGDIRNDLYLTIEKGEFERGGKSSSKNVEVTVVILDASGKIIESGLYKASNYEAVSQYSSIVLYHQNSPQWSETVKIALPIESFYGAHVRLEYRHCSTKDRTEKRLLGFSFTPLMDEDGTVLPDGSQQLLVYKCEDINRIRDSSSYLNLPYSMKQLNNNSSSIYANATSPSGSGPFQRNSREIVTVEFCLCSTKLTQNADLLSLLKWKSHPERIAQTLDLVMRLRGEELVKFLQDVLDSLFSMFTTEEGYSTQHSGLVFQVLTSILSLLEDSKFEHFKPVVDAYITDHFSAALAHQGLASCIRQCANLVHTTDKQDPLQKCFRTLHYLFEFIIRSRLLFAQAVENLNQDEFKNDLFSVFSAFNKMVSISFEAIVQTQITLLKHIYPVIEKLQRVLSIAECAKALSSLIDSIPRDPPHEVSAARMSLILATVTSDLFKESEARSILLPTVCRQLRSHLSQRQDLVLSAETIGRLMSYYRQKSIIEDQKMVEWYRDVEVVSLAVLDVLIQAVLLAERTSPLSGALVSSLLSVLQLMDQGHYDRLWDELAERKPLKDFLLRLFVVLRDLVQQEAFSADWRTMQLVANQIILKSLNHLSLALTSFFLNDGCFDTELWSSYFNLAVAFLTQPSLQLENRTESQRRKILGIQGDMRVLMGFQTLSMWDAIGDYKIHFIPSMVGPFLQVTLVPEQELRQATLPLFFDMMDCEQRHRGNFKQVESELIYRLDVLVGENQGDENYKELFHTILLEKVRNCDVAWRNNGAAFIHSITRLLERLLDYRNVMNGEENRDKRMSCTFNLLNFYKNEVERKDMYLRYIYKLHDLHLQADNYTEAAFTLQLHASQLTWSSNPVQSDERCPSMQLEWQRKETLYLTIIDYFDRGKCWEKGLPLCKELADFYETHLYDYGKLSNILRKQAIFYDNILTQLRPEPEYFRVGFYGMGFPLFLRNKVFIYRGLEYERIGAFTQRLQTEFPSAQILTKNTPPSESILNAEEQFIQICNVKPLPEDHPVFDPGLNLNDKILSFYRVNDVRRFQFDRPVHKGTVDKDNEFKSLWIERTLLSTGHSLPGILRWFEVVERSGEEISPVKFACETVQLVNRELQQLSAQYLADSNRNINPLSMRLQGVIDAAVMGGIGKYQEAFFTAEFINNNPAFVDHVLRLRQLIVEQMKILESTLALHGRLIPATVQPLHRRLTECFAQMKQRLKEWGFPSPNISRYANTSNSSPHHRRAESDAGIEYRKPGIVTTPLPPLPTDKRPLRAASSSNRSSGSSGSLYGYSLPGEEISDEEDLYCKPSEILEKLHNLEAASSLSVNIPTNSATLGRIPQSRSPRWQQDYIFFTPASRRETRDSGFITDRDSFHSSPSAKNLQTPPKLSRPVPHSVSDEGRRLSLGDAPPLPPRSSVSTKAFLDQIPPPVLPKSYSRKLVSPDATTSPDTRSKQPLPPPLPPKASTPLSPPGLPPPVLRNRGNVISMSQSTSVFYASATETSSGSLVEEVCSILTASGCPVMPNGRTSSLPLDAQLQNNYDQNDASQESAI